MSNFNVMAEPRSISERLLEIDFYAKIKEEALLLKQNVGVYKELEEALLAEWQDYPNSKLHDYLCYEKVDLEKLKIALSFWRSLPSDPIAREILFGNIKKRGEKDPQDDLYLSEQLFERYHRKNLSLLRKHWHNCFPGEENIAYNPETFSRKIFDKSGLLDEILGNLDYASLYVDLTNEPDTNKRFKDFLKKISDAGLFANSDEFFKNYYTFLKKNLNLNWEDWEK